MGSLEMNCACRRLQGAVQSVQEGTETLTSCSISLLFIVIYHGHILVCWHVFRLLQGGLLKCTSLHDL